MQLTKIYIYNFYQIIYLVKAFNCNVCDDMTDKYLYFNLGGLVFNEITEDRYQAINLYRIKESFKFRMLKNSSPCLFNTFKECEEERNLISLLANVSSFHFNER